MSTPMVCALALNLRGVIDISSESGAVAAIEKSVEQQIFDGVHAAAPEARKKIVDAIQKTARSFLSEEEINRRITNTVLNAQAYARNSFNWYQYNGPNGVELIKHNYNIIPTGTVFGISSSFFHSTLLVAFPEGNMTENPIMGRPNAMVINTLLSSGTIKPYSGDIPAISLFMNRFKVKGNITFNSLVDFALTAANILIWIICIKLILFAVFRIGAGV